MEDAHKHIVHDHEDGTPEIIAEIGNGLGKYFLRSTHPPQDGGSQGNTRHRQHNTGDKAQGNGRMDRLSHGIVLSRSVVPGNDHTGTHGNAVKKAHHHKNQTARRTDRRQGFISDKVAHAPGIKSIV